MNLNLLPYALVWGVLAAVVIALIVYRKMVASHEDDTLHVLDGEAKVIPEQMAIAQRLERIDRWGKLMTVIAIVYGLAVGAAYVYQNWVEASNYMGR
jgi:hypothetical protein